MTEVLDNIAALLRYPTDEYKQRIDASIRTIKTTCSDNDVPLARLLAFNEAMRDLSLADLEELYTRTFDINPVSSLEVGWHLHGETYERGAFLVTMREVLRRCQVEELTELPDHLTHVLPAVARMSEEEAEAFVSQQLLKALNKMLEGFIGKENPYEHVLVATKELLMHNVVSPVGASHD
ncbi:MAG: molecular chaperone TorD family protein [Ignavibacteriae bacterium]|nr:molecular chaperone TorD family protein [Ignavibacteriota bacterium]